VDGADITTQQKSRLRRAYRETLTAADERGALAAFYERFTALYGITAGELWDFLSDERTKRETQPTHKVAAATPAKKPRSASTSRPQRHQKRHPPVRLSKKSTLWSSFQPPSGMAACPVCGTYIGPGALDRHKSPSRQWCDGVTPLPSRREKRTCRICKQRRGVRQTDGRMVSHKAKDGTKCGGSGRTPLEGRGSSYMTTVPVNVVGGGLPGLGRQH
jgi:hypothetical protein